MYGKYKRHTDIRKYKYYLFDLFLNRTIISYLVNVKVSLIDIHKQSFPSFHDCSTYPPLGLLTH